MAEEIGAALAEPLSVRLEPAQLVGRAVGAIQRSLLRTWSSTRLASVLQGGCVLATSALQERLKHGQVELPAETDIGGILADGPNVHDAQLLHAVFAQAGVRDRYLGYHRQNPCCQYRVRSDVRL